MNRIIAVLVGFVVVCVSVPSWAGPAEEVAQIAVPRAQAFQDGDIDAFVAAYADDAVFHPSFLPRSGLRAERRSRITSTSCS